LATAKNVRSSPQKRPLSSVRSSKANRRNECDPFGNGCCIAQFNLELTNWRSMTVVYELSDTFGS
jgi:hypothetical protein